MENREQQIFLEIRDMISSMRAKLDDLEVKVNILSQELDVEEVEDAPIELDIEDVLDDVAVINSIAEIVEPVVDAAESAPALSEPVVDEDEPDTALAEQNVDVEESVSDRPSEDVADVFADLDFENSPEDVEADAEEAAEAEEAADAEEEAVAEEDAEVVEEAETINAMEAVEEIADDDLPAVEILIDAAVANAKPAVIDAMTAKEAWRTDIPGSPVKDIRSAISLHDRILFINGLFGEDPILFQEVLTAINSMTSVDEVVGYLAEKRPDWDMNSDSVYRFMMAVRRRIQ